MRLHPLRARPAGRLPLASEQPYGAKPPDTPMVPVYAVPTVAVAGELMVSVVGLALFRMLSVSDAESVDPLLSVTCAVKLAVPAVRGVPLSTPSLLSAMPAGREPEVMVQVYGVVPPLAASSAL